MDCLCTTKGTVESYYCGKKIEEDFHIVIQLMFVLVRNLAKKLLFKWKMFQTQGGLPISK